ncbi:MAG: aldo/keto reductase [wastewater metagenome]|nr:aldo/keto reductase [Candidatus Loosdrechtia aerotolerans]
MFFKKDKTSTRRHFLKDTITFAAGLCFAENLTAIIPKELTSSVRETGVPKRRLGKTEAVVSMLCVGGYHIGRMRDENYATRMVHAALDEGANFFDSAWCYNDGMSEQRLGKALKNRRDKAFVMTKNHGRDIDTTLYQLHQSLNRLQTDYIDLLQFHNLQTTEEAESIFREGGAIEAVLQAKKEGKVRYVGFTGHRNPEVHVKIIQRYHHLIDTVQMPVNLVDPHYLSFIRHVIPEAIKHDIGILAMKTIANGILLKDQVATIKECLYFAWNQPISTLVSGMDSIEQMKENANLARQFERLSEEDQSILLARTAPFCGIEREFYKHPSQNWRIFPSQPIH